MADNLTSPNVEHSVPNWSPLFFGDETVLAKLRSGSSVSENEIATLAHMMCAFFGNKSPFAFVNDPRWPEQRFLALRRRRLFFGAIYFAGECLPDMRRALIQSLRFRRRTVSDFGTGQRMSPEMKILYRDVSRETAIGMGLDLPSALKAALLVHWSTTDAMQRASFENGA